jgi:hypothetical protein
MIPDAASPFTPVPATLSSFRLDGLTPPSARTYTIPSLSALCAIRWERNPNYDSPELEIRPPSDYSEFGFSGKQPLYSQVARDFDRFQWISKPGLVASLWQDFRP